MPTATTTLVGYWFPFGCNNAPPTIEIRGNVRIEPAPAAYAAGGVPIDWKRMFVDGNIVMPCDPRSLASPLRVHFWRETDSKYVYGWNAERGTIHVFALGPASGDAVAELPDGTPIPADVSSGEIRFEASFAK